MAHEYYLALDCETCDHTMRQLVLSTVEHNARLSIDVGMAASQLQFDCDHCGAVTYTGDLDTLHEPGAEPSDEDDDE